MSHVKKFVADQMARWGITEAAAYRLPGALQAEQMDEADSRRADGAKTVDTWLKGYDGKGFRSVEDREAAFRDPQYKVSQSYRDAVAVYVKDTPDEIMGLVRPHANVPTTDQLIKQARMDLFKASKEELFHKAASKNPVEAAEARLALVEFEQNPENAALVAELDRTDRMAKPLEYELKQAKAEGRRVGTEIYTEKPADAIEGQELANNPAFTVNKWSGQSEGA
jgi:hypothetical protein